MNTFKEKLINILGSFGLIIFFVIRLIISVLPFVMIGGNFLVTFILISISGILPISSVIFWIWGLFCAISGQQDLWAIMYYVAFAVIWLPFYISLICGLISKLRE